MKMKHQDNVFKENYFKVEYSTERHAPTTALKS